MKSILSLLLAAALAAPAAAGTFQRELPATAGEKLSVELRPGGAIEIRGWDRNAVTVDASGPGDLSSLDVRRSGSAIAVEYGAGPARNVRLRIQVPRRFDLALETNGGDIVIDHVEGTIEGATRGGALRLSSLGGKLKLSTNGGEVSLRDSTVDGSVSTMGGNILLENVAGGVKASTMGGDLIARSPSGGRAASALNLSTMGGNILVEDAPAGALLSTMGGNVVVRKAGGPVKAKSMGGNVSLLAVNGSIDAATMGGNVSASLVGAGGARDVTIESKGGDVDLTVPAGYDASFDVEIVVTRNSGRRYGIQSELPISVTTSPEWDSGSARRVVRGRGQSGAAGNKVRIRTMDGDVKIHRAQ